LKYSKCVLSSSIQLVLSSSLELVLCSSVSRLVIHRWKLDGEEEKDMTSGTTMEE